MQRKAYIPLPIWLHYWHAKRDGMCLDCFLLTREVIKSGDLVEVEPVGMFEQIEAGKEDHNILAVRVGERFEITHEVRDRLLDFVLNVFAGLPGKTMHVGRFLGKSEALRLIEASLA